MNIYLGIDPGYSGGITAIRQDYKASAYPYQSSSAKESVTCYPMPDTPKDIWELLYGLAAECDGENDRVVATIEQQQGFIGTRSGDDGESSSNYNKASAHTMFRFGRNYGHLEAFLITLEIRAEFVSPQTWMRFLKIPTIRGEKRARLKARLKERAQSLFPKCVNRITLDTADSLLIAEYCRLISTLSRR